MTVESNREQPDVPPVVPFPIIPAPEGPKPRGANLYELRICASLFFVVLFTLLGLVVVPTVWPGWEELPGLWPLVWPLVLPLIGLLVALSKRSYLRYVRVRQV
ncbi:hypothetical protein GCM10012285_41510 [Streptomyces kronopolitis]|uniref:Integral membrane protein n=1 Tax=Streptomyces kronopolitis TaxID=1612435 RepID=A0ABQ2JNF4_9ACTN|nr:hypothetical protein [Streptomyces kronopolitis]GGN51411.1 hypothetical protein GCM10012285_41510 [Streptomyces kronopolitis]